MASLKQLDQNAAEKGSGIKTLWQFVKFIVVSLLAFVVQFALLNILNHVPAIENLTTQEFNWFVFTYPVAAGGLGYFISSNVSNIAAQIVSFFVNREKTFNANNNIPVTLTIYLVFTVALICFSAWLNPTIKNLLVEKLAWGDDLASNAATMVCCTVQFLIYFPFDKLLMREKKDKNAPVEENK